MTAETPIERDHQQVIEAVSVHAASCVVRRRSGQIGGRAVGVLPGGAAMHGQRLRVTGSGRRTAIRPSRIRKICTVLAHIFPDGEDRIKLGDEYVCTGVCSTSRDCPAFTVPRDAISW
jgi:hypothetical protein